MTAFWYALGFLASTWALALGGLALLGIVGRIVHMLHLKEILAALEELNRFLRSVPWDKLVEIVEKLDDLRNALEEKPQP